LLFLVFINLCLPEKGDFGAIYQRNVKKTGHSLERLRFFSTFAQFLGSCAETKGPPGKRMKKIIIKS